MHIKIYFGNKPLFLCDSITKEIEPFLHHDDAVFIDGLDSNTIKTMIHEMQAEKVHAGIFYYPDFEKLKKDFFKKFIIIKAGGGLVINNEGAILLIHRRGKWDLPKGKLDAGETIEQCAVREVEEETGLKKIKLTAPLLVTYHTYHEGSRFILKESHWYKMQVTYQQHLTPQTEEDIVEAKWVVPEDIKGYLSNCFPSVVDVLQTCFPE